MYKGYTEWIMKLFAVMAIQIDFSLSLTVYFVSELWAVVCPLLTELASEFARIAALG